MSRDTIDRCLGTSFTWWLAMENIGAAATRTLSSPGEPSQE
jgi:hypothetical protein